MLITASFIIAKKKKKKKKQPKCSWIGAWVNKICVNTVEWYLAINRSQELTHASTWMLLGNMFSSKDQIDI